MGPVTAVTVVPQSLSQAGDEGRSISTEAEQKFEGDDVCLLEDKCGVQTQRVVHGQAHPPASAAADIGQPALFLGAAASCQG